MSGGFNFLYPFFFSFFLPWYLVLTGFFSFVSFFLFSLLLGIFLESSLRIFENLRSGCLPIDVVLLL